MGFFDFLKSKDNLNSEAIEVSNKAISEAAHEIANDCYGDMTNPKWLQVYNLALDNLYGNALYLGYGETKQIEVNLNDPLDAGAKRTFNMLNSINAPKENIQKALFRLLKEKKFSGAVKNIFCK